MTDLAPHVAWTDPDWLARAYGWIDARLAGLGLERVDTPEQIHAYPWATVLRVSTSSEQLFFKAMMPLLTHEAPAVSVLAGFRPALVTDVAAWDAETGWMLMRDAGVPIRDDPHERIEDWEWLLSSYAALQRETLAAVGDLLAAGVPDRGTTLLPELLHEVLEDDDAVWVGRERGLTDHERTRLRDEGLPRFSTLCEELAALPIRDTIQHDDLHAGNVFVREAERRILDWGDACIAHPLASLLVPLRSLVHRQVVAEGSLELDRLRDAYLEPWSDLAPRADLLRAVDLGRLVGCGTRLLSWQRIVPHFEPPIREDYGESVPRWFRQLLDDID
jgi:hypothetical protein